ncbi:unnamed protein product [Urochloa humidicola]
MRQRLDADEPVADEAAPPGGNIVNQRSSSLVALVPSSSAPRRRTADGSSVLRFVAKLETDQGVGVDGAAPAHGGVLGLGDAGLICGGGWKDGRMGTQAGGGGGGSTK